MTILCGDLNFIKRDKNLWRFKFYFKIKVGERKIRELRQTASEQMGERWENYQRIKILHRKHYKLNITQKTLQIKNYK